MVDYRFCPGNAQTSKYQGHLLSCPDYTILKRQVEIESYFYSSRAD